MTKVIEINVTPVPSKIVLDVYICIINCTLVVLIGARLTASAASASLLLVTLDSPAP